MPAFQFDDSCCCGGMCLCDQTTYLDDRPDTMNVLLSVPGCASVLMVLRKIEVVTTGYPYIKYGGYFKCDGTEVVFPGPPFDGGVVNANTEWGAFAFVTLGYGPDPAGDSFRSCGIAVEAGLRGPATDDEVNFGCYPSYRSIDGVGGNNEVYAGSHKCSDNNYEGDDFYGRLHSLKPLFITALNTYRPGAGNAFGNLKCCLDYCVPFTGTDPETGTEAHLTIYE